MERNLSLATRIASCFRCPLSGIREQEDTLAVPASPGEHYQPGGLAFMVGAPDRESVREAFFGAPFGFPLRPGEGAGRQNGGDIFNSMLEEAGILRADVLTIARVRCQVPRNRVKDHPEAVLNCDQTWMPEELSTYDPAIVVLMGNNTTRAVYGATTPVSSVAGHWQQTGPDFEWGARLWLATFDPVAVLRNPELRAVVVGDFRRAYEKWLPF